MGVSYKHRFTFATKPVWDLALRQCHGDILDATISVFIANSVRCRSAEGSTSVLFPKETWRYLTGSKEPYTGILEAYSQRYGCSFTPHTWNWSGCKANTVTLVGSEHVRDLVKLTNDERKTNGKRVRLLDRVGNAVNVKRVNEDYSKIEAQTFIRKYIQSNEDILYEPTDEDVESTIEKFYDDEIAMRYINSMMFFGPTYEPVETSYRLFDEVWSNARSEVRRSLFPHFVELDLKNAYVSIVEYMCRQYNIPCALMTQASLSSDAIEFVISSVKSDLYEGSCVHGVRNLPTKYKEDKQMYIKELELLKGNKDLIDEMFSCIESNSSLSSLQGYFYDPITTGLSQLHTVRDVIKAAIYKELFGASRKSVYEFLTQCLPKTFATAVYGSSFFQELGQCERALRAHAERLGLKDAWGNVASTSLGLPGKRQKRVKASQVIHFVCSSYELLLVHQAYLAAYRRADGRILLHQHDGIAVSGSDAFVKILVNSVNKECARLGINSEMQVK